jgi:endonuclease/exonuclease/phosphatase family metal-dependent hydrolase
MTSTPTKWLILSAITLCFSSTIALSQPLIKVCSFNIRFNNPKDAPNDWPARKDKVTSQLLFHEVDIIGVQEALHGQLQDMLSMMPGYRYTGVGRDDGKEVGEYSCIFYNTQKFELLASQTFWLSLTPTVAGSKSWDAAITRIVTWARFKEKKSGRRFMVFNTHFDHVGKEARRQSAHLLLRAIDSLRGGLPAIVTGDFNATPADEPMQVLTQPNNPLALQYAKNLSKRGHYGPTGTFNGFGPKEQSDEPIDHILLKGKWLVEQHATLSQTWQGRFASDHFAVMAVLKLK